MGVTTVAQSCVSGDGRENDNMWLPYIPRRPSFKYYGRLIAYDDANNHAMRSNLRKARGCWAARMCRMFYKATVQAVLCMGVRQGICLRRP